MKTIILATNQKRANYIRKGLEYENLSCSTVSSFAEKDVLANLCEENDGIFVYCEDCAKISSLLSSIHSGVREIPVIVLSAEYMPVFDDLKESRKIVNFFIRPFPFRQMASDMKFAVFNVKEKLEVCIYTLRDLELDIASHQVRVGKEQVYLRNKEFSLLHFLMLNKGKVLSRNEIIESVWDRNTDMLTNTVDVHISKLRKKIEKGAAGKFIRTVPCLGYVFE